MIIHNTTDACPENDNIKTQTNRVTVKSQFPAIHVTKFCHCNDKLI